jgi:hypothetical protein
MSKKPVSKPMESSPIRMISVLVHTKDTELINLLNSLPKFEKLPSNSDYTFFKTKINIYD